MREIGLKSVSHSWITPSLPPEEKPSSVPHIVKTLPWKCYMHPLINMTKICWSSFRLSLMSHILSLPCWPLSLSVEPVLKLSINLLCSWEIKVLHHRSRKKFILQYYNPKFDFNKCIWWPKDHIVHQKIGISYTAGETAPSTKIFKIFEPS